MVCTGARSEGLAIKAVRKVVRELRRRGIVIVGEPKVRIQNIVASADLGGEVDLVRAAYRLERCMYEPDQFPGVICRMDDPKVAILLFHSGKLVCAGAKREREVYEAVRRLHAKLEGEGIIHYED
jgi:transcription initiation factor TFIID TATA-box-binding protein